MFLMKWARAAFRLFGAWRRENWDQTRRLWNGTEVNSGSRYEDTQTRNFPFPQGSTPSASDLAKPSSLSQLRLAMKLPTIISSNRQSRETHFPEPRWVGKAPRSRCSVKLEFKRRIEACSLKIKCGHVSEEEAIQPSSFPGCYFPRALGGDTKAAE